MFKFKKPKDKLDSLIQSFLTGAQLGKHENYCIEGNTLLYKKVVYADGWRLRVPEGANIVETDDGKVRFLAANIIAKRIVQDDSVYYLGNSSVLNLIGMRVAFGNVRMNFTETDVQRRLAQHITMIPFGALREAGLDLNRIRIVERGPAETITRKRESGWDHKKQQPKFKEETVHFTGACLFSIDAQFFLLDIDRNEIQHKIFNPFVAQLPKAVKSIKDAYESLKPDEVKRAERKGLKVLRQGEWFFIKTDLKLDPIMLERPVGGIVQPMRGILQAGNNRPNRTEKHAEIDGQVYVSGLVEHSGREHNPIKLDGWFKPIANTATRSVTITGDID